MNINKLYEEKIDLVVLKVFAPLTRSGVNGWVFKLVCPGNAMSISHDRLLLLNNATVNNNFGFDHVCNEKHAYIAYNNFGILFELIDGRRMKMILMIMIMLMMMLMIMIMPR